MNGSEYFFLFAGMGLVTYIPRCLPLLYLAHRRLPEWLVDWLRFIPVSILSALLAPALFIDSEQHVLQLGKPELLAAVPTFLIAVYTRSLGGTVLAAMVIFWVIGLF
jgi:branched-subunit amino acid transport protein